MNDNTSPKVIAFPEKEISTTDAFLRGCGSPLTQEAYAHVLAVVEAFLAKPVHQASRREIESYVFHMKEQSARPATIAQHLAALSSYTKFCLSEEIIAKDPMTSVRRPKVSDRSTRTGLTVDEMSKMIAAADMSPTPLAVLRDKALITLLALQGTRLAEALNIHVESLRDEGGRKVAFVVRKGGKEGKLPLAAPTVAALAEWTSAAGISTGPIFVPVDKHGLVIPGKSISPSAAWKLVRRTAARAGLADIVHPHLFRHGAITAALAGNVPLEKVQDFAGHADPRTTRRYDANRDSLNNPTAHILASIIKTRD